MIQLMSRSGFLVNPHSLLCDHRRLLHFSSANRQKNEEDKKNNKDDNKKMQPMMPKLMLFMLIVYTFALLLNSVTSPGQGSEVI